LNPPAAIKRLNGFEDRGSHRAPVTSAKNSTAYRMRGQARKALNGADIFTTCIMLIPLLLAAFNPRVHHQRRRSAKAHAHPCSFIYLRRGEAILPGFLHMSFESGFTSSGDCQRDVYCLLGKGIQAARLTHRRKELLIACFCPELGIRFSCRDAATGSLRSGIAAS
jgi:hypothetical protein